MGRVVTNKHRLGRALRRYASGSFEMKSAVKRVEKRRVADGLDRSNYTKSCVENYLWALVLAGQFTVRKTPKGVHRFRPTAATAAILRDARAEFPGNASTFKIGTYIWGEVGPIPTMTKSQLFVLLYERGLLNAPAAPAESEDDANTDVDMGDFEEAPHSDVPNPAEGSQSEVPPPRTPPRPHPAQAYPSPPNTTSPIARYQSRVSVNRLDDDAILSGPAYTDSGSSEAASIGKANPGVLESGNAGCVRPECQQREQEFQRTRAELEAAQAEAAEMHDELEVLQLLQIDLKNQLADSHARNEHLVDECTRYKQKHCGAQAALSRSQALAGRMQQSIAACAAQYRYV